VNTISGLDGLKGIFGVDLKTCPLGLAPPSGLSYFVGVPLLDGTPPGTASIVNKFNQ